MSTQNPANPDDGSWVKPANHPCKLRFEDIQNDWDNDYENLVNTVQRHTNCSTAYCLRKKGENDEVSCRFNFPKKKNFVKIPIWSTRLFNLKMVGSTIRLR